MRQVFERAVDVVEWLGAVQAQDYAAAKWAVGLRMRGAAATDAGIDQTFNAGLLLRTHVLRPTWHFVLPRDIRWMLTLTAPRVHAAMAWHARHLGFDAAYFRRGQRALAKELAGGRHMTRRELAGLLRREGVALGHVLIRAELDAVICSGPMRGKQHTWALLDERVPATRPLAREHAMALLARRFVRSHGPATVNTFAWWSGLTLADARLALSLSDGTLRSPAVARPPKAGRVYLLPNFDEYLLTNRANGLANSVVVDGRIVGTWRRTLTPRTVRVEVRLKEPVHKEPLARAVARYGRFLGRPASFQV
jgi:Winged helix DNA-binding domain